MRETLHKLEATLSGERLCDPLRRLADSGLVALEDAFVLRELAPSGLRRDDFADATGFEALANKIHVNDFLDDSSPLTALLQGMKYAERLVENLSAAMDAFGFRVMLSRDPNTCEVVVRFHGRRAGQTWVDGNLDAYAEEEVILWDT